jgi:hypothetical protein
MCYDEPYHITRINGLINLEKLILGGSYLDEC